MPYPCGDCGKNFIFFNNMLDHQIKKHGIPKWKCARSECRGTIFFNEKDNAKFHDQLHVWVDTGK